MTYIAWETEHSKKVKAILEKIGEETSTIVSYFSFDNMVEKEESFCPLYTTNTKCHDIENLNCFFCACPYFKPSYTNDPLYEYDGIKVMSVCALGAKNAKVFIQDNVQHCDCTDCTIPHGHKFTSKYLENSTDTVEDSVSLLEAVRAYQLNDIFGKWKIF